MFEPMELTNDAVIKVIFNYCKSIWLLFFQIL